MTGILHNLQQHALKLGILTAVLGLPISVFGQPGDSALQPPIGYEYAGFSEYDPADVSDSFQAEVPLGADRSARTVPVGHASGQPSKRSAMMGMNSGNPDMHGKMMRKMMHDPQMMEMMKMHWECARMMAGMHGSQAEAADADHDH